MPRNRKPHPRRTKPALVDVYGKPVMSKPAYTNEPNPRLFALQREQEIKRETERKAGAFNMMELDELGALIRLAHKLFGDANQVYAWSGGDELFRYGGMLEGGAELGVLYLGFYIDPPSVPTNVRRRKLLFRGCKISEFEEQARVMGMNP